MCDPFTGLQRVWVGNEEERSVLAGLLTERVAMNNEAKRIEAPGS